MRELTADDEADAKRPFRRPPSGAQPQPGEPIPVRRLEAAAARGKLGGMRTAKDNLVGGPPVPPSPETDAKIRALFRVDGFSAQEQAKMSELILRAGQVAATSAPRLKTRTIARRVAASKLNAAPGPSGWRNT